MSATGPVITIPAGKSSRPRRRTGCVIGCLVALLIALPLVLVVAIVVLPLVGLGRPGLLGPIGGLLNAEPVLRSEFGIELRDLDGADPGNYAPLVYYPQIKNLAGPDAELVQIRLTGVRSDGTLDLNATYTPAPRAEYTFQRRLSQPPPNAPPIGAGGSATGAWFEPIEIEVARPGQRRSVSRTGGGSSVSVQYTTRGIQRQAQEPTATGEPTLQAPTCALRDLWAQAIARGAPAGAVATIEYGATGYRFAITSTPHNYTFGTDCQMMTR
jgi:hypothetical protein